MAKVTNEVIEAARSVSAESKVEAAVLLAVAIVETNAVPFAVVGGRREPLIRFEGHYFDRLLSPDERAVARRNGLSDPRAGKIANPVSQEGRWRLFDKAAAIDAEAAAASVSWGLCQVMGAHWRTLGFSNADSLGRLARSSAAGQFRIAAAFLAQGGLAARLSRGDTDGFARAYNGPGYRRNDYGTKIGAAYLAACELLSHQEASRAGDERETVRRLQGGLVADGASIAVDGIFGPATRAALAAFQRRYELAPTEPGDPRTLAHLMPCAAQRPADDRE